jgi:RND family efflux transporter MFP subunit
MPVPPSRLFLAISVSLLILAAGVAASHADNPPRPVRVQAVTFAQPRQAVTYTGTVQPRVLASLGFRVAGKVTERLVDIGQTVHADQVLARLDAADAILAVESAQQVVAATEADTANARAEFARYQRLGRASPAFIASEFDKRKWTLDAAEARLAQAQRQLALARDQQTYTTLTADADGVITGVTLEAGQVVAAGQPVLTLAHAAQTEVAVDVPENRLPDVRAATDVSIRLWSAPDRPLLGRVREIGALADSASRTFSVRVSITEPPPDAMLGLGMTASVRFSHMSGQPVARLPASAIVAADGVPSVWVLDEAAGRAVAHPVRVRRWLGDGAVEISDGVAAGALVVTAGASQIDAAVPVTAWQGTVR